MLTYLSIWLPDLVQKIYSNLNYNTHFPFYFILNFVMNFDLFTVIPKYLHFAIFTWLVSYFYRNFTLYSDHL